MSALTAADLRRALACVRMLGEPADAAQLPQILVRALAACIPSDTVAFTEVPATGLPASYAEPGVDMALYGPIFERHVHEHPVITDAMRNGQARARAISDYATRTQYRSTGLYRELYRPMGLEDQLAVSITVPGETLIGVSLSRDGWGFSGRDHELLDLLRPHMLQARRRAEHAAELRRRIAMWEGVLGQVPGAIVAVDGAGRPIWMTAAARQLLESHYPREAKLGRLPHPLVAYAAGASEATLGRAADEPLRFRAGERTVLVTRVRGEGHTLLTLASPADATHGADPLRAAATHLGLTDREAEVMHWVARGKTNPQIAAVMHVSPRTVQKHLEHVYEKLRVQTRTAALHRLAEG